MILFCLSLLCNHSSSCKKWGKPLASKADTKFVVIVGINKASRGSSLGGRLMVDCWFVFAPSFIAATSISWAFSSAARLVYTRSKEASWFCFEIAWLFGSSRRRYWGERSQSEPTSNPLRLSSRSLHQGGCLIPPRGGWSIRARCQTSLFLQWTGWPIPLHQNAM